MSTYRLSAPYEHSPLRRRLSGLALALAINFGLLLLLLTLGIIPVPGRKNADGAMVVISAGKPALTHEPEPAKTRQVSTVRTAQRAPVIKPPPIVIPSKPTIALQPSFIEMSSSEMAAADISNLPHAETGSAGDSEAVGRAPNGDLLYAAEWARHPTDAELGGYLPKNSRDGSGLIACKTMPDNRVDDCIELGSYPPGSHLASAVRQAAWQFRVRPPRKNGKPLIGSWVRIRIDYETTGSSDGL